MIKIREFTTECQDFANEPFDATRIKYKQCDNCIVMLYVPKPMKNDIMLWMTDLAFCVSIFNVNNPMKEVSDITNSFYEATTTYSVDGWVFPDLFTEDINDVCTNGIHSFLQSEQSEDYFNHWIAAYFLEIEW